MWPITALIFLFCDGFYRRCDEWCEWSTEAVGQYSLERPDDGHLSPGDAYQSDKINQGTIKKYASKEKGQELIPCHSLCGSEMSVCPVYTKQTGKWNWLRSAVSSNCNSTPPSTFEYLLYSATQTRSLSLSFPFYRNPVRLCLRVLPSVNTPLPESGQSLIVLIHLLTYLTAVTRLTCPGLPPHGLFIWQTLPTLRPLKTLRTCRLNTRWMINTIHTIQQPLNTIQ